MLVDLLVSLLKTIGAGLLKLWWLWLILLVFSVAIILLKGKSRGYRKQTNNPNQSNTCPKCGGYLKKISGKYGPFFGCSNFPKCAYKQKL